MTTSSAMDDLRLKYLFRQAKEYNVPTTMWFKRAGVARSTLKRWRENTFSPTQDTINRLSEALDEIIKPGALVCECCGRPYPRNTRYVRSG